MCWPTVLIDCIQSLHYFIFTKSCPGQKVFFTGISNFKKYATEFITFVYSIFMIADNKLPLFGKCLWQLCITAWKNLPWNKNDIFKMLSYRSYNIYQINFTYFLRKFKFLSCDLCTNAKVWIKTFTTAYHYKSIINT